MESEGCTPPGQKHNLRKERIKYWSVISDLLVTFTVSVESVTVLEEVTDLGLREESEPVAQRLHLTALEAGILIEMLQNKL